MVSGFQGFRGLGFRVSGFRGFRVWGLKVSGYRVSWFHGFGLRAYGCRV